MAVKLLEIAWKDLRRAFTSPFGLGMTLLAPLLVTGLIFFAFSGQGSGGSSIVAIKLVIVNLDQPPAEAGFSGSQSVVQLLTGPQFAQLLITSTASTEAAGRQAVADRQADAALIIPPNFSAAVIEGNTKATLTVVQDPALQVAPSILRSVLRSLADSYSGSRIALQVALEALRSHGLAADAAATSSVVQGYVSWAGSQTPSSGPLEIRAPVSPAGTQSSDSPIGPIMAGMLVFFVFYSGALTAESILREDEEGTLARLFTTPTAHSTVLGGKVLAVFLVLVLQTVVLLLSSWLLFGIRWGGLPSILLTSLGMIAAAGGFGLLVMSLIRTTRQAGPVLGGLLVITAMLGGLFTAFIAMPPAFKVVNLTMPQGWAMQGWKLTLAGAGPVDLLSSAGALLGMALVFFLVALWRFRRRFA